MTSLPRIVDRVGVPPIKCQGIKTKLVPFIASNIRWESGADGRWIEPFVGSGVVVFNLRPDRALLSDTNEHIIRLYQRIQNGEITQATVRQYLAAAAPLLAAGEADYFYEVRSRFNNSGDSLDFLFLNRSCFNGVMRFNKKGGFNVPFGHKPERFSKAYITKIINQVGWISRQMHGKDWEFRVSDWRPTLAESQASDFVYLDPPYIGRHTDYFNAWDEDEARDLAEAAQTSPAGVALSMWQENRYRRNTHLDQHWADFDRRLVSHFYHVGSTESLRNEMLEALVIRPGFAADATFVEHYRMAGEQQLTLAGLSPELV
ncbi:MAG: Dam family site-specific DNA-(adenine-N6)-methyltransferase [Chloroflexia bacterium]|nr:Dam family site-specific DNA-(adenine-N6)-methyltransferase [Chloroflexia bacterium]